MQILGKYLFIVTRNSRQINRNNSLCPAIDSSRKRFIVHLPCRDRKSRLKNALYGGAYTRSVDLEEGHHNEHSYALVAVNEGVV